MKQVNKYVVFKNTYEPETILYFFQSREDAMSFKVKEEEASYQHSWTVASVDSRTPSWFRKMWIWLESKTRCC